MAIEHSEDITVSAIVVVQEAQSAVEAYKAAIDALNDDDKNPLKVNEITFSSRHSNADAPPIPADDKIRVVIEGTYEPEDDEELTHKDAVRQHADALQMDKQWYGEVFVGSQLAASFERDIDDAIKERVASPDLCSRIIRDHAKSTGRAATGGDLSLS